MGDKIGSHGADVISVNIQTGRVTLWDAKYRSAVVRIQQSPTFKDPGRLQNAIDEAISTLQSNNSLPQTIRATAIRNLQQGNVRTRTMDSETQRILCLNRMDIGQCIHIGLCIEDKMWLVYYNVQIQSRFVNMKKYDPIKQLSVIQGPCGYSLDLESSFEESRAIGGLSWHCGASVAVDTKYTQANNVGDAAALDDWLARTTAHELAHQINADDEPAALGNTFLMTPLVHPHNTKSISFSNTTLGKLNLRDKETGD